MLVMLMEILFGILGLIVALIMFVTYRNRKTITAAINVAMIARKTQKDLEKAAYNEAMTELMPEFAKAKAIKDIEKKLNKKPLAEKLSDMSKELTKDVSSGGKEAKGLNSIMDDMNVFNQKATKGWATRSIKNKKGKKVGTMSANTDVLGDIFGNLDRTREKKDMDFLGLGDFKSNEKWKERKSKKGKSEFWGTDF